MARIPYLDQDDLAPEHKDILDGDDLIFHQYCNHIIELTNKSNTRFSKNLVSLILAMLFFMEVSWTQAAKCKKFLG
jgi:hypothetical protein